MDLNCAIEARRRALFKRIADFPLDHGSLKGFSNRLRLDQGWSPHFTQRAIEEYRKFLWIAATADREVTPPKSVDEVWHLHILHTRSYFDDLCRDTLGFLLHHNPGDGSPADARFTKNYNSTLALYEAAFGPPPPDIWPRPMSVTRWMTTPSRHWLVCGPSALFATPVYAANTTSDRTLALTLIVIAFLILGIILSRVISEGLRNALQNMFESKSDSSCSASGISGGDANCHDDGGSGDGAGCGSSCGAGCGGD